MGLVYRIKRPLHLVCERRTVNELTALTGYNNRDVLLCAAGVHACGCLPDLVAHIQYTQMILPGDRPIYLSKHASSAGECGLMSALNDENPEPISKVHQIRRAANVLGISERTVYRRLRSGKLEHLPTEPPVVDTVMSIVSSKEEQASPQDPIALRLDRLMCQNDMTHDNLAAMRQEMAQKDAQIRSLLENQQELTRTIQKLQAQIFELARLALLQSARSEEPSPLPVPSASQPSSETPAAGNSLTRWLRSLWARR